MPRVSIIIPVWNHAEELRKTLAALRSQTFQDFEVIIVDDASTDAIQAVMDKEHQNGSFEFVRLSQHSGAPRARNEGFNRAQGEHLLFLDADAVMIPSALSVLVQALDTHTEASFAYASFIFGVKLFRSKPFSWSELQARNYIHTSALIRREAFPGFDESLRKFQDWDLWLTIAERGGKGIFVDQTLFSISERKQGMSRWLPSFLYKLPWPFFGWTPLPILKYREAEKIIRAKHHLV